MLKKGLKKMIKDRFPIGKNEKELGEKIMK